MTYTLINHSTGEIISINGEYITPKKLYDEALSLRRAAIHYNHAQEKIQLIKCFNNEQITQGIVLQEWEGGLNTPIEDLRLCVRTYYTLKNRKCDTVGLIFDYLQDDDIFHKLPSKALYVLAKKLRPYNVNATCAFIRKLNLRRIAIQNQKGV